MPLPVIKATEVIETKHADGRVDVMVRVPLIKLAGLPNGYKHAKKILMDMHPEFTEQQIEEKLQLALKREKEKENTQ